MTMNAGGGAAQLGPGQAPEMHSCEYCGGTFPGRGVIAEGRFYCTDLCAGRDTRRRSFLSHPLVIGGVFATGLLLGTGLLSLRSAVNSALFARKYHLSDYLMSALT